MTSRLGLFAIIFACLLSGCSADQPLNPAFPLTLEDAKAALAAMEAAPVPLPRPVVVLGGYLDPGFGTPVIRNTIERIGGGERVISVHFFAKGNFDACREHVLRCVEEAFPCSDPAQTTEVDVVAGSMGGIVARYAAMAGDASGKRLRIARLFTVSTPHRGASMAALPLIDPLSHDMRCGSPFLARLDGELAGAGYEIVPYVRLGDAVVGPENAAPPGRGAWWVANQPLQFAHLNSFRDERIRADIARRLRGEEPFAKAPAAPVPAKPAGHEWNGYGG